MSRRIIHHFDVRAQRGLTLIELMVSIVLGMILVAAIATLIANQSGNRVEVDKSGRMIENGRYATQTMVTDLQMAGYWGEIGTSPKVPAPGLKNKADNSPTPGGLPNPCNLTTVSDLDPTIDSLEWAMGVHVQGYDSLATLPAGLDCVKNHKPNTDVLVVRRVDPVTSDVESGTPPVVDWAKVKPGQIYLQTGLNAGASQFDFVLAQANGTSDAGTFDRFRKDRVTKATPRKYLVHIYYVSNCSVEVGGSCASADGGTPIPTLKRVDMEAAGGAPVFTTTTLAEGIENFQVDYHVLGAGDSGGSAFTGANWADVVSVKLHLLARSIDKTNGFADTKSYAMGTAGSFAVPTGEKAYKRHLFVQTVRLINPSGRKAS
jgi:type IV pilus assembly protein PilW